MSLVEEIVCRGAPRDLGLDQGVAGREGVRREVRRAGAADGEQTRRIARDVRRFFPHTAERAEGLALGAQVSEANTVEPLISPITSGRNPWGSRTAIICRSVSSSSE